MERLKSGLKNALAFLVVGPAVGVVIYMVWATLLEGEGDWAALLGIIWLLPIGYLLGAVPAVVTGFLIGVVTTPRQPLAYLIASGGLGGLAAGSIALLDSSEPSSMDGVTNLALIGALASLGTAGVRLLFNRLRASRTPAAAIPQA